MRLGQMRRGVSLLGIVLLGAALAAAVARADGGGTTTTDTTTTDTTTSTTTTTTTPTYTPLVGSPLPQGCVSAGVAAIKNSQGAVVIVKLPSAGLGASAYPASHPYLTVDSATRTGSGCGDEHLALTKVSPVM